MNTPKLLSVLSSSIGSAAQVRLGKAADTAHGLDFSQLLGERREANVAAATGRGPATEYIGRNTNQASNDRGAAQQPRTRANESDSGARSAQARRDSEPAPRNQPVPGRDTATARSPEPKGNAGNANADAGNGTTVAAGPEQSGPANQNAQQNTSQPGTTGSPAAVDTPADTELAQNAAEAGLPAALAAQATDPARALAGADTADTTQHGPLGTTAAGAATQVGTGTLAANGHGAAALPNGTTAYSEAAGTTRPQHVAQQAESATQTKVSAHPHVHITGNSAQPTATVNPLQAAQQTVAATHAEALTPQHLSTAGSAQLSGASSPALPLANVQSTDPASVPGLATQSFTPQAAALSAGTHSAVHADTDAATRNANVESATLTPAFGLADTSGTAAARSLQEFTAMVAAARATSGTALAGSTAAASTAAMPAATVPGLVPAGFFAGQPQAFTPGGAPAAVQAPLNSPQWASEFGRQFIRIAQATNGLGQVAELRLDPPELGPLRITINLNDNVAHAVFSSPHAAVRQTVENALPQLQQMLEQAGISLGQANVNDQGQPGQGFGGEARSTAQHGHTGGNGAGDLLASADASTGATHRPADPNALVDTFA